MRAPTTPQIKQKKKRSPARSPEARENQLINAAVDLAEKQLDNGTASAQVITHYLKLATSRERLEKDKLARETELLKAKTDALQSVKKIEELYNNALNAMQSYRSNEGREELDIDD
jgi:hypothetical protein